MCVSAIQIKRYNSQANEFQNQPIQCGKCPQCVKAKISSWLFRFEQEDISTHNAYFVTLTYKNEHLKYVENYNNEGEIFLKPTLVRSHVSDFMKRLRYYDSGSKKSDIRYYAVGEYGSKKERPHYHLIIWNLKDPELINKAWTFGRIDSPNLNNTNEGLKYLFKYLSKRKKFHFNYAEENRLPEFSNSSKRIGKSYLTRARKDWHLSNPKNTFVTNSQGYRLQMPKYYKDILFTKKYRYETTQYLQQRIDTIQDKQIMIMLSENGLSYTDENVNKMLNLKEVRKNNSFFDKFVERDLQ